MNKQQYSIYRHVRIKAAKVSSDVGVRFGNIKDALRFYNEQMQGGYDASGSRAMDWMVDKILKNVSRYENIQSAEEAIAAVGIDPNSADGMQLRRALDTKIGNDEDPGNSAPFRSRVQQYHEEKSFGADNPYNAPIPINSVSYNNPYVNSDGTPAIPNSGTATSTAGAARSIGDSKPAPSNPTAPSAPPAEDGEIQSNVDAAAVNNFDVDKSNADFDAQQSAVNTAVPSNDGASMSEQDAYTAYNGGNTAKPAAEPKPTPRGPGEMKDVGTINQPVNAQQNQLPPLPLSRPSYNITTTGAETAWHDPEAAKNMEKADQQRKEREQQAAEQMRNAPWHNPLDEERKRTLARSYPTTKRKSDIINGTYDTNTLEGRQGLANAQAEWQKTYDAAAHNLLRVHGDAWRARGFTQDQINNYVHNEVMKSMERRGLANYPGQQPQEPVINSAPKTMGHGSQWSV